MSFNNFKFEVDGDGIALVTWDMPGRSMNVIDGKVGAELNSIIEQVTSDAADLSFLESINKTFSDVARREGEEAAKARLFEQVRNLSLLYRRLETCGKPWAAAINGTALGGGFELCLACHHRVAAQDPRTRVGLPEVKIGLFPGAGGTQRVARMMQPGDAMQMLMKGDQLRVDRAKGMKLIDAVVPPEDLIKTAKDWVKANPKAKAPWDQDGFKLPGGLVYSRAGMMVFPPANAIYRRET